MSSRRAVLTRPTVTRWFAERGCSEPEEGVQDAEEHEGEVDWKEGGFAEALTEVSSFVIFMLVFVLGSLEIVHCLLIGERLTTVGAFLVGASFERSVGRSTHSCRCPLRSFQGDSPAVPHHHCPIIRFCGQAEHAPVGM
jgi:hypothetical protein